MSCECQMCRLLAGRHTGTNLLFSISGLKLYLFCCVSINFHHSHVRVLLWGHCDFAELHAFLDQKTFLSKSLVLYLTLYLQFAKVFVCVCFYMSQICALPVKSLDTLD